MLLQTLQPIVRRPKSKYVREALNNLALQVGPDGKLPTMSELCRALDVANMTLVGALKDLEARDIIERRHGVGLYVSPRIHQKTVGLVYGYDIFQAGTSPWAHMLVKAAQARSAVKNEKFRFYLDIASDKEGVPTHHNLADDLKSDRLNGVICAGVQNPHSLEWIRKHEVPLVALASRAVTPWRVAIDHAETIKLAVRALSAEGCRQIALMHCPEPDGTLLATRVEAFHATMEEVKLAARPEWIWSPLNASATGSREAPEMMETKEELGCRAVMEIFGKAAPAASPGPGIPDGLVSADDMMTRGAVMALQKLGLRAGRDVRIATHANRGSPALRPYAREMILVEVNPTEVVEGASQQLETLMDGRTPPEAVVLIRPRLVHGQTMPDNPSTTKDRTT